MQKKKHVLIHGRLAEDHIAYHLSIAHEEVGVINAEIVRGEHVDLIVDHAHVGVSQADTGQNQGVATPSDSRQNEQKGEGSGQVHVQFTSRLVRNHNFVC